MCTVTLKKIARKILVGVCGAFMIYSAFISTTKAYSSSGGFAHQKPSGLAGYGNEAVGALSQIVHKHDLANEATGVWKVGDTDEHGVTFMYGMALDYFRCSATKSRQLHEGANLEGITYVIAPWEADALVDRGFKLVHDENWVYLYKTSASPE